ncbi:hypothetical protein D4Q76_02795 [archaeon]|nr:MAG: hypothetical protein D4Q76_02795 [archaeon]
MADKTRILVVGDFEYKTFLDKFNKSLKHYQLEILPNRASSAEELVEQELSNNNYGGALVDILYLEIIPIIDKKIKKCGVIKWGGGKYGNKTKEMLENKKVLYFGNMMPSELEKELDAIFA